MRIRRFIAELCTFPHRGSGSANERRAAEYLVSTMRAIGLEPWLESFRSQARMTWELVVIIGSVVGGVVLARWSPVGGWALATVGLFLFWGHFSVRFKPVARLFCHAPSQNVVARVGNQSAKCHVVLAAHYDTARSRLMWHPKQVRSFRANFMVGVAVLVLVELLLLLRVLGARGLLLNVLLLAGLLHMLAYLAILLHAGLAAPRVQGAADNASGVAVLLDLAVALHQVPLRHCQVWVLATGSQETGALGMRDFVRRHAIELPRGATHFLVFDSLGSGKLHYCLGEGMLDVCRFRGPLVELARQLTTREPFREVTPLVYRLAYTDAIVPARHGYPTLLLLATDAAGRLPHWHWPTDTLENVDFSVPELASRFALALLRRLDEVAGSSAPA
ncbi:MAG: M28 family metallopeptidase [Candidatus Oleimicrobiaceae bacterium]